MGKTPAQCEEERVRRLRTLVDFATTVLRQGGLTFDEARRLIAATRSRALELFPDKSGVFDLVILPRFRRILQERFKLH